MHIAPFELERFFAEHEHGADVMLAESGIRSLPASRFDLDPGDLDYVVPTQGDPDLRAQVADRYGRGPDEVAFTCGTQEANLLAFLALLSAGDHAVVVTPTYQSLHAVPEALARVTRVDLEPPDWRLEVDAVRAAVEPDTAVVVLNNPNNPTGRYHPESVVRGLYEVAADAGAFLLCDEVYRLLAEDPLPPVAALGDRGVSTTSLTKAHGLAGLRFGWLAGPPPVVEAAVRWKDYTTISPSLVGQHVARQVLADEEAILTENRALAGRNRDRVRSFLEDHGLTWHDPVGVNGFVPIPDIGFADARAFCEALVAEESVVLAPGTAFGVPDHVRIGFGLPEAELAEGLARVGAFLERHGG